MQDASSTDGGRIKVGGIKLSPELVQFNISRRQPAAGSLAPFLEKLAENRINLTFLSVSDSGTAFRASFCVLASDFSHAHGLVAGEAASGYQVEIVESVGTMTIFPHQRRFALLGRVLGRLKKAGIPIHAVCTSLSSLAINTEFRCLDAAVRQLLELLELPGNHAPFRSMSEPAAISQ